MMLMALGEFDLNRKLCHAGLDHFSDRCKFGEGLFTRFTKCLQGWCLLDFMFAAVLANCKLYKAFLKFFVEQMRVRVLLSIECYQLHK